MPPFDFLAGFFAFLAAPFFFGAAFLADFLAAAFFFFGCGFGAFFFGAFFLGIDGGILGSWSGAHVSFGGMEITAVPEPATYVLMLAALCVIAARFTALRTNSQMTRRLSALKANIHAAV